MTEISRIGYLIGRSCTGRRGGWEKLWHGDQLKEGTRSYVVLDNVGVPLQLWWRNVAK